MCLLTGEYRWGEDKRGNECVFGEATLQHWDTQRSSEPQVCQYPYRWPWINQSSSPARQLSKGKDNPYLSFHNIPNRVWDHVITAVKKIHKILKILLSVLGQGMGLFSQLDGDSCSSLPRQLRCFWKPPHRSSQHFHFHCLKSHAQLHCSESTMWANPLTSLHLHNHTCSLGIANTVEA